MPDTLDPTWKEGTIGLSLHLDGDVVGVVGVVGVFDFFFRGVVWVSGVARVLRLLPLVGLARVSFSFSFFFVGQVFFVRPVFPFPVFFSIVLRLTCL